MYDHNVGFPKSILAQGWLFFNKSCNSDLMNCDVSGQRFLLFVNSSPQKAVKLLENMGANKIIVRRHSDSTEIDFTLELGQDSSQIQQEIDDLKSINPVREDFSGVSTLRMLELADELVKEERFWEAHNVLEFLWKGSSGSKRALLHEVIGIIVSQIKVQMGQMKTGEMVYKRSLTNLKESAPAAFNESFPADFAYPLHISLSSLAGII